MVDNFHKVRKAALIENFTPIFCHDHQVVFTLIGAMSLFPDLHLLTLPGKYGGRDIPELTLRVLFADKIIQKLMGL